MMDAHVVDTNVIAVANRRHDGVSPACVANCAQALLKIKNEGKIALDDARKILSEYHGYAKPKNAQPEPGDAFMKWLLQNIANKDRCDLITITDHAQRGFESFPDDDRLNEFDPSDRKFVAVAAAHPGRPPILQAADCKWLNWVAALLDHNIAVTLVCDADIRRFHQNKFGGA